MKIILKNKFIGSALLTSIILSIAISLAVAIPVFKYGEKGMFYSIDPDVVYVANSLSFIKNGAFGYHDHPGTPQIVLTSISYLPLRVFSKIILKENFINWSYNNYAKLFIYSRLFQCLIFSLGVILLLQASGNISNTFIDKLLITFILLGFLPVYYSATSISAETLTLTISTIWIYIYSHYLKVKSPRLINLLFIVTGIMLANRATSLIYVLATIIIILIKNKNTSNRISVLMKSILLTALGFVIGVWPLRNEIDQILSRIFLFARSTGVHGAGTNKLIDLTVYAESVKTFVVRDPGFVLVVLMSLLFAVLNIFKKKDKMQALLGVLFFVGILIFAKFPLAHYQLPNYVFITFYLFTNLALLRPFYKIIIIIFFVALSLPVGARYYNEMLNATYKTAVLENYLNNNKYSGPTFWIWARSENFAKLWTRDWGSGVFDKQLENSNDNFEINTDMISYKKNITVKEYIKSLCNFRIIGQTDPMKMLISANKNFTGELHKIEGSDSIEVYNNFKCF